METQEGRTAAQSVYSSSWNGSRGSLLSHQTAGQPINHERLIAWSRLGVVGISEPRHIASELDDCVLKPAARSKEWLP